MKNIKLLISCSSFQLIYIYIYINTIKSSCTECNKNNIDIQKKHYRLNVSTEVFISNTLQIKSIYIYIQISIYKLLISALKLYIKKYKNFSNVQTFYFSNICLNCYNNEGCDTPTHHPVATPLKMNTPLSTSSSS